jgi:ABC-type branched-subunit amino acid transport system substrate-binding protein
MRKTRIRRSGVVLAGLALVLAACGSDSKSSDTTAAAATTNAAAATTTAAAATTTAGAKTTAGGATTTAGAANTAAPGSAPAGAPGALEGFKGTTPLVDLSKDFKDQLLSVDPALKDFNYAAETYDAITIIALSTEEAKTDGIEYASKINGVTRDGTKCTSFADCKKLIDAGTDIDYDGKSGPLTFAGNGEPTEASYGLLSFGANNRIDDTKTKYIQAKAPADADVAQVPVQGTRAGDGTLTIGSILPQTGSLAFLGPPEFAAFDLAIKDINAAGGVLGKPVVGIKGDSGDATTDTASKTVDSQLSQNVDAIIGAASSGVSLTVIDKITGAGVVQFSPANTSKKLSTYDDKGLYFRTAPSDIVQGAVLAGVIQADGVDTVGVIARNDAYGTGLTDDLTKNLEAAGIKVVVTKIYDEKAGPSDTDIDALKAAAPAGVAVIGFDESSKILATMVEKGIGPKDLKVYGVDGNTGNALGTNFDAGK